MSTGMYDVGRRVASRRALQGIGQKALGEAVNIDRSHISRIERGERYLRPYLAEKIAAVLGTTAGYLLTGVDGPV